MGNVARRLVSGCLIGSMGVALLALVACSKVRHSYEPAIPTTLFSCSDVAVPPFAWNAPEDILYNEYVSERGGVASSPSASERMAMARQVAALLGERGVTATAVTLDGVLDFSAQVDALKEQGYLCVILGQVERYEERIGSDWSVSRPASVAFKVLLVNTVTGRVVWKGRFDEAQQPLSENLLTLKRFVSRKAHWVTAGVLLTDGLHRLVDEVVHVGANPRVIGESALVQ